MKITYEQIINNMKTAFFERCGERAADFSDVSARLEAAASELFSLACRGEYVLRQAFAQSAEGEYLDFHAALRGITRKENSKAEGALTFYCGEPAVSDIEIPSGTLCSKQNEPFIQFETTESAVLQSGETQVTVGARATDGGYEYNAPANTVTVSVNAPAGLDGVANAEAFTGGYDAESDVALRERILSSYSIPQTAFSLASIREALMKRDDITDCKVYYDSGEIRIPVRLKTGANFNTVSAEIESDLALASLLDVSVSVTEAQPSYFSLSFEIKTSSDGDDIAAQVRKKAAEYVSSLGINGDASLNALVYTVSKIDGVEYCEVSSPSANQGLVLCAQNSYLAPDEIAVSCYE